MYSDSLVGEQETSLELVVVSEDGTVQSVCEQAVFGTIKDLRVLPWNKNYQSPQPEVVFAFLQHVLQSGLKIVPSNKYLQTFINAQYDNHNLQHCSRLSGPCFPQNAKATWLGRWGMPDGSKSYIAFFRMCFYPVLTNCHLYY